MDIVGHGIKFSTSLDVEVTTPTVVDMVGFVCLFVMHSYSFPVIVSRKIKFTGITMHYVNSLLVIVSRKIKFTGIKMHYVNSLPVIVSRKIKLVGQLRNDLVKQKFPWIKTSLNDKNGNG